MMAVVERLCEPISFYGARRDLALESVFLAVTYSVDIDIHVSSQISLSGF
jgi:hypothetical protein